MSRDLIQEALRAHLVDATGLTVYADAIPSNAIYPAIALTRVVRTETQAKDGRANLIESLMQITIVSDRKVDVREVSDQIRDALLPVGGYRGPMGSGAFVVEVQQIRSETESDVYAEDVDLYYRHCDYTIRHRYEE